MKLIAPSFICLFLSACAVTPKPNLLPQSTYSSAELLQGVANDQRNNLSFDITTPLRVDTDSQGLSAARGTSTTAQQVANLNRDFLRVRNPDIIGFVYAHRVGEIPIPGYATVFPLYSRDHIAVRNEGFIPDLETK